MNNEYSPRFPPPFSRDLFRGLEPRMIEVFGRENIFHSRGVDVVNIHCFASGLYGAMYNVVIGFTTVKASPMYVPQKQVSVDTMSEAVQARVATLLTFGPMDITQLVAIPGVGIRMLSRMIVLGDDDVDGQDISVA